jgi:hypothetical protein
MKKQLAKAKNAVKRHAPEILTVTVSAAALVAYAAIVIKTNGNSIKIKLGPEAMNALEDGSLTRFQTEDEDYIYTIAQK